MAYGASSWQASHAVIEISKYHHARRVGNVVAIGDAIFLAGGVVRMKLKIEKKEAWRSRAKLRRAYRDNGSALAL